MNDMIYSEAKAIADRVVTELRPYCERIEIAGSIRRKRPEVKDIEVVCIPKPYETGLFESGIASIVNKWTKVKGELPCKYTQRILPDGIKLDLFFAEAGNWGLIYAIRTGSAEYSHKVLANAWVKRGYHSCDGYLFHDGNKKVYEVREEIDLFNRLGLTYVDPELRNL
jgi:DNA polymerase/3'-5' exonuclease PolX